MKRFLSIAVLFSLFQIANARGQVVVPVPGDLQVYGTIEVRGDNIPNLPHHFTYYSCALDDKSHLYVCRNPLKIPLNVSTRVRPGTYKVYYFDQNLLAPDQSNYIKVEANQNLVLNLSYGELEVQGTPGKGQDSTFSFLPCRKDDGGITRCIDSAEDLFANPFTSRPENQLPLGTYFKMPAGDYALCYSKSCENVSILENQRQIAKLGRIEVPHVDGTYSFAVFHDFTDHDEFLRVFYLAKTISSDLFGYNNECNTVLSPKEAPKWKITPGALEYCNAPAQYQRDHDLRKFVEEWVTFHPNGTAHYNFVKCNKTGRWLDHQYNCDSYYNTDKPVPDLYVTDPGDGDFVSLFPGTYGIDFKAADGKTSRIQNIHVEANK